MRGWRVDGERIDLLDADGNMIEEAHIEINGARRDILFAIDSTASSNVVVRPASGGKPVTAGSLLKRQRTAAAGIVSRELGGIKMSNIPVVSSPASQKMEFAAVGPEFFERLTFRIVAMNRIVSLAQFASIP